MSNLTGIAGNYPLQLFKQSDTKEVKLGQIAYTEDGRKFRYAKLGVDVTAGLLLQAPAPVANHQNCTIGAAAAIGATSISVVLGATAATADQYAEGYMVVNDEAGQGYCYKVKSNPASDASVTMSVVLEDPLVIALTTSSQVCLIPNKYNGVIVNPATATSSPVGVAAYDITSAYYGWIQTQGVASVLNDSATTVGLGMSPSAAVDGALKTAAATLCPIAYALQAGVTTEYRAVDLRID